MLSALRINHSERGYLVATLYMANLISFFELLPRQHARLDPEENVMVAVGVVVHPWCGRLPEDQVGALFKLHAQSRTGGDDDRLVRREGVRDDFDGEKRLQRSLCFLGANSGWDSY